MVSNTIFLASNTKGRAEGEENLCRAAAPAEDQNLTMNATSLSPFLPSFLETTCDGGDVTLVEDAVVKLAAATEAPKLQGWESSLSKGTKFLYGAF